MTTTTTVTTGTWALDPAHTEIGFSVRHLMSKVRGTFGSFEGTIVTAEDLTRSTVEVSVDLSSIDTGTPDRDNHLRSGDFFDAEVHPAMTFTSREITERGEGDFRLAGDLTIKGVTRPLDLAVEFLGEGGDPWGGTRIGVHATGELSRKEYGIDFNVPLEGDKVMIGDRITISIDAEAVLQV